MKRPRRQHVDDVGVNLHAGHPADGRLDEVAALREGGADEGDPAAEGIVLGHRRGVGLAQLGEGVARDREEAPARSHEVDPPEVARRSITAGPPLGAQPLGCQTG